MRKQNGIQLRTFRCPHCGAISYAPKSENRRTGAGHPKNMWCWSCQREDVQFIQVDCDIIRMSC